jgi:hypothetical protein
MEAAAQRNAGDVEFEVGPIEMELSVEIRKEKRAGGAIKAYLFSADGGTTGTRSHIQRITFTLTPQHPSGGGPLRINDQDDPGSRWPAPRPGA